MTTDSSPEWGVRKNSSNYYIMHSIPASFLIKLCLGHGRWTLKLLLSSILRFHCMSLPSPLTHSAKTLWCSMIARISSHISCPDWPPAWRRACIRHRCCKGEIRVIYELIILTSSPSIFNAFNPSRTAIRHAWYWLMPRTTPDISLTRSPQTRTVPHPPLPA